ncbi:MAG: LppP/LprE family lipoprotein, partial [Actinomycetota bacterium]|nr:LppP/LprE family lipoprotein [Actinomycetota bacterium]
AAPTRTPSPTPTPTPTPVPLTPEERAERRAAAEQVRQQGYEPVSLKAYDPDQNLRVLLGEATGDAVAAGAAEGRRAFFFIGGEFIGTDATEPSDELRIVAQTNNTVTLRYGLDTGESVRVRFKWEAGTLSPQTPIPPALQRQG